jgi:hypothetical protein
MGKKKARTKTVGTFYTHNQIISLANLSTVTIVLCKINCWAKLYGIGLQISFMNQIYLQQFESDHSTIFLSIGFQFQPAFQGCLQGGLLQSRDLGPIWCHCS